MSNKLILMIGGLLLIAGCNGSSKDVTVTKDVVPKTPSSICKSFSDKSSGVKERTWCDYFDNPGIHPCTEVVVNSGSTKTYYYFDEKLPANDIVDKDGVPSRKGGLVAFYVKDMGNEAITTFRAYIYANGAWKLAASADGQLYDGMGENSYYLSPGKYMSSGVTPDKVDESLEWEVNGGKTCFTKVASGFPCYVNYRDESSGYDRVYYPASSNLKSETLYTAVRDYDRLFGEEFTRYEVSATTNYNQDGDIIAE